MARQSIRVEGLRETEQALLKLRTDHDMSRATVKNTFKRALIDAARPFEREAEQLAPKLSGRLGRSIEITDKLSSRQKAQHVRESGVEIFVGARALPHAHLQEFGTKNHAAQPFLRPAWDRQKMSVLSRITAATKKQIAKTIERAERKAARAAAKLKAK